MAAVAVAVVVVAVVLAVAVAWHLRVAALEPGTSCERERRVGIAGVGGGVRQCHTSAEHQGQRTPHVSDTRSRRGLNSTNGVATPYVGDPSIDPQVG